MKEKKLPIYYLLGVLFFLMLISYNVYSSKQDVQQLSMYRPGYYNNCYKVVTSAEKSLEINNVDSSKLISADHQILDDYQESKCISQQAVIYQEKIKLDQYKINHQKGRNDQTYQTSYDAIKAALEKKKNPTALESQLIKTLDFVINEKEGEYFLSASINQYLSNHNVIGLDGKKESGTYVLQLKLVLIKNDIYELKGKNKKIVDSVYTFDSLKQEYVKESK